LPLQPATRCARFQLGDSCNPDRRLVRSRRIETLSAIGSLERIVPRRLLLPAFAARAGAGAVVSLLISFGLAVAPAWAQTPVKDAVAPYVPTPWPIVDRMLTLAGVGADDYVVDLGSGDGRLVTTAVAKYKARGGLGVDIDAKLVKLANDNAAKAGVGDRARFVERDLFVTDIGAATVVTLYLTPGMLERVEAKLSAELKPGTRVISHDYPLPTWQPVDVVRFDLEEKRAISGTTYTQLMLYRVPAGKP
jgi:hypothetical protein